MSLSEIDRFHKQLRSDSVFFEKLSGILHPAVDSERKQKIVELARLNGFNFSEQDLTQYERISEYLPESEGVSLPREETGGIIGFIRNVYCIFRLIWGYTPTNKDLHKNRNRSYPFGKLDMFFIWLSGASSVILTTCSDSEQRKHSAFGGAVLIPTFFSWMSSSFLLRTLNFSVSATIVVPVVWAFIILMMDRALLATYRAKCSFGIKLGQLSLRLAIAFLIAITIAHPVVLLLFNEIITNTYNKEYKQSMLHIHMKECSVQYPSSKIFIQEDKIKTKEEELKNFQAAFPPSCKINNVNTSPIQADLENARKHKTERALTREQIEGRKREAAERAIEEEKGDCKKGRTCRPGCGPKCLEAKEDKIKAQNELKRIDDEITGIDNEIERLNGQKNLYIKNIEESQKRQHLECEKQLGSWKTERKPDEDGIRKDISLLKTELIKMKEQCTQQEDKLNNQSPDILRSTIILHDIIWRSDNYMGMLVFLAFTVLFLLIDMLAIILKVTSTMGLYESKVSLSESNNDVELLDFAENRVQTIVNFAKIETLERNAIEGLHDGELKSSLQEAQEFLISSFRGETNEKISNFFRKRRKTL